MDTGFEKTRRNLIVTITMATIYIVADLTPNGANGGIFNFTVGNTDNVKWIFFAGVAYFWIRYLTYYFEENIPRKRKQALDLRIKQVALEHFEKKYPAYTAKDATIHHNYYVDYDYVDNYHNEDNQYAHLDAKNDHIEIDGIEPISDHMEPEDVVKMSRYERDNENTGKEYAAIMRKARWSFPFKHSYLLEKDIPAILPIIFFVFAAIWYITPPPAIYFDVEDIRVKDGDTFEVHGTEYRSLGFDAFEKKQECKNAEKQSYACGQKATEALQKILSTSDTLKCRKTNDVSYKRPIVKCWINGKSLAAEMIKTGWALDYAYFTGGKYKKIENKAKMKKLGAWDGCFANPYKWRHKKYMVTCYGE